MTTATTDYSQYTGQRVVLTLAPEGESTENSQVEGKVEVGNALGLLFKVKGKAQPELVEAAKILSVEAAPDKPKVLKAKSLKEVEAANVRAHLLERHGVDLTWANGASDIDAEAYHMSLDHAELLLGHVHKAAGDEPTERDEAVAAAEAAAE